MTYEDKYKNEVNRLAKQLKEKNIPDQKIDDFVQRSCKEINDWGELKNHSINDLPSPQRKKAPLKVNRIHNEPKNPVRGGVPSNEQKKQIIDTYSKIYDRYQELYNEV